MISSRRADTRLDYYASFKLTDDRIEGIPGILIRGKNKVFVLGPEVQLALAKNNTSTAS